MSFKNELIKELDRYSKLYKKVGDLSHYHAYKKAANSLKYSDVEINSDEDIEKLNIKFIGPKIREFLKSYIQLLLVIDEMNSKPPKIEDKRSGQKVRIHRNLVPSEIEPVTEWLKSNGLDYVICGSYRRNRDYVGDVDILVVGEFPEVKIKGRVYTIVQKGDKKIKLRMKSKYNKDLWIDVDLRSVRDYELGCATLYFTGSREFNIYMRMVSRLKGYKLNEYCFTDLSNGNKYYFMNEYDVFHFLDMDYIEPEFREGIYEHWEWD